MNLVWLDYISGNINMYEFVLYHFCIGKIFQAQSDKDGWQKKSTLCTCTCEVLTEAKK